MSQIKEPSAGAQNTPGGFYLPAGLEVDKDLLKTALTHRSWAFEHGNATHNERLEFLGDAVLGQIITWRLYTSYPDATEGELSKRRAALVSSYSLADLARKINLGAHLRLGRGERQSGGRSKESILADALEAVIGAVYVDLGLEAARQLIEALFADLFKKLDELIVFFDPKTTLQEEAAARGLEAPKYEITAQGPDHDKRYEARVSVAGKLGTGVGSNKKAAELSAAKEVVRALFEANELKTVENH